MSKFTKKKELSFDNNDDPLSPDMEFIKKELKYLRTAIDKQNKSILTITAMLREVIKEDVVFGKHEPKISFPIETEADLNDLEKEIEQSPGKYNDIFRDMVFGGRGGLEKNLRCILSSEVALHYNWDGTSGKKPFKNFKFLNQTLFMAIKPEITSPDVYQKAIRQGLKRIKNLHFKRTSLLKKQECKITVEDILTF